MKIGKRELNGASCELRFFTPMEGHKQKAVREINSIEVRPEDRGQGRAKALLESICREADQRRMVLVLSPGAYGSDPKMTTEQLMAWYVNDFDFVPIQAEPLILARMYDPFPKPILANKISQIIQEGIK